MTRNSVKQKLAGPACRGGLPRAAGREPRRGTASA